MSDGDADAQAGNLADLSQRAIAAGTGAALGIGVGGPGGVLAGVVLGVVLEPLTGKVWVRAHAGRPWPTLDELAVTISRTLRSRPRPGAGWQAALRKTRRGWSDCTMLTQPIRKGRIDRPVEVEYKARSPATPTGVLLDYGFDYGAALDGPQMAPAIQRITRGRTPVPTSLAVTCRGCRLRNET